MTIELQLNNRLGLHLRVASLIVRTFSDFECRGTVSFQGQRVDAASALNLVILGAEPGSRLFFEIDGAKEHEAVIALSELFARNFDED